MAAFNDAVLTFQGCADPTLRYISRLPNWVISGHPCLIFPKAPPVGRRYGDDPRADGVALAKAGFAQQQGKWADAARLYDQALNAGRATGAASAPLTWLSLDVAFCGCDRPNLTPFGGIDAAPPWGHWVAMPGCKVASLPG